ncbi:hypothetical protein A3H22_00625 [Candidatus Peribacteria bacterium RIFCSPLOWO2_12_FULL_55_15]|nr:MAG: hypothetical protein A2789_02725 [Candidatus Peribacteria bacterium RIFCSPHIGHO2_01_FULL_54_22]OGJ62546.1 MAG: hypothetical protein A3D12_02455 [Candidatus Peribacteria bacterium RIFCSPHIGHO2_02_FULL_55_24]OGJ63660.1 MAG: hypothetical protein A3E47_01025 [Candidatus Peribacteria bacterium RIFCSPHIGHO2_12_FULL_54_10]OGJ68570.1 MAG: hypothetical protein A2947_01460 [Candidatus Peribacteria bacterium RIFCSPLOWO2_01_FULL_54_110]OGJ69687.1 MAG: hypothetical protein A3H90_01280 [Candidatus Pe
MGSAFLRKIAGIELAERLLNGGALVGILGVFLPWISGEWPREEPLNYAGFQSYTAMHGIGILALNAFILSMTLIPLAGGPHIVTKQKKNVLRLLASSQAVILTLLALSVLTSITFEFSRMGIRFGIYVSLLGNLLTAFEAFYKWQEQQEQQVRSFFHYEESPMIAPLPASPTPSTNEYPLANSGRGIRR